MKTSRRICWASLSVFVALNSPGHFSLVLGQLVSLSYLTHTRLSKPHSHSSFFALIILKSSFVLRSINLTSLTHSLNCCTDMENTRRLFHMLLRRRGLTVALAAGGQEALQAVRDSPTKFDLILM